MNRYEEKKQARINRYREHAEHAEQMRLQKQLRVAANPRRSSQ